jgi:aspartate 1-decarboxylase
MTLRYRRTTVNPETAFVPARQLHSLARAESPLTRLPFQTGSIRSPSTAWTGDTGRDGRCQLRRSLFKSKIHRATVTHADLSYEGSVTIDETLLKAADILPYERVHIWNASNGSRLETYALAGPPGSGVICVNGAAARHAQPGDVVIIATFAEAADEAEARAWRPLVVRVDGQNRPVAGPAEETPGPALPPAPRSNKPLERRGD